MPRFKFAFWLCLVGAAAVLGGCRQSRHRPVSTAKGAGRTEVPRAFLVQTGPVVEGKPAIKEDPFAGTNVLRIEIEIPPDGMEDLRASSWGTGQARPVARAIVREGGGVFTNVAVHLKGSAGSFRPVDSDPGLTLNFEKYAPGQTFHGLHKISLNNSVQDRSFLTEKICRELFLAVGVPTPRAGHAKVWLNGRDLGVHVLVEGFNKQFLKRYFKNAKGNLYDAGFSQDITGEMTANSGENPQDRSGLDALISAATETNRAALIPGLEKALDMDRFMTMMALEVILVHWDGYAMNRNNYRLFHDLEENRMVFFPHGMDQMFGVMRKKPDCSILPQMHGLVARAALRTSEGRVRYLKRVAELYTNVFHVEALLKRVDELAAVVRPAIAESNEGEARVYDTQVFWLKNRIVQRDASLKQQLASVRIGPASGTNTTLQLTGWEQRGPLRMGNGTARLQELAGDNGSSLLYIGAMGQPTTSSWRARANIAPGRYRFEGRVRTKDVRPWARGAAGDGATIRISGGIAESGLMETADWRSISCPFEVVLDGEPVEFICELKRSQGEAWFDTGSLRVVPDR